MTYIRAWMSSKFGRIRTWTTELAALERPEKSNILIMGNIRSSYFSAIFDRILFILASNEGMHKILDEFEFRSDSTTDYEVSCP